MLCCRNSPVKCIKFYYDAVKEGLDVVSGIVQLFDNVLILQNQVLTEQ